MTTSAGQPGTPTAAELRETVETAEDAAAAAWERGHLVLRWVHRGGSFTTGAVVGAVAVWLLGHLAYGFDPPLWLIAVVWAGSLVLGSTAALLAVRALVTTAFLSNRLSEQEQVIVRWVKAWAAR